MESPLPPGKANMNLSDGFTLTSPHEILHFFFFGGFGGQSPVVCVLSVGIFPVHSRGPDGRNRLSPLVKHEVGDW